MDSVRGQHERFVALGAAVDALQDVIDVGMVRFSGNHCVKKESRAEFRRREERPFIWKGGSVDFHP